MRTVRPHASAGSRRAGARPPGLARPMARMTPGWLVFALLAGPCPAEASHVDPTGAEGGPPVAAAPVAAPSSPVVADRVGSAQDPRAPSQAVEGEAARVPSTPAGTGTRWIQLLGYTLLLGAVGVRYGVLPVLGRKGALPELRIRIRGGIWRFGWAGALLLLLALPLRLAQELGEVGAGAAVQGAPSLLFQSAWGAGWFLHLAVVVLSVVGLLVAAPRGMGDRGWGILAATAFLLPLTPVLQGNAWGGGVPALAAASLYLHVGGVGLWLGGLILLLLVGLPALKATPVGAEEMGSEPSVLPSLARLVNAFSRIALPAVVLVVLTGLVNAWSIVGSFQGLLGTAYGWTLLLKLALVAGALSLGFHNWRRIRPRLAEEPDPGALRIPASVEAVLGILVLLITAALVGMPPP